MNLKHLDDFPTRDENHKTQEVAETAFRNSVSEGGFFFIQHEDRRDYGTDFQLEVINNSTMTNVRIHVQVKGTEAQELSDGSISRSVARTNLNYLLSQPCSVYICYHLHSKRLLYRFADDVYREYEHQESSWHNQKNVTVNFVQLFDSEFQKKLKDKSLAFTRLSRDERLSFSVTPPDQLSELLKKTNEKVIVPSDPEQAKTMINELYNSGKDHVISNSFDQFSVELSSYPKHMLLAYMAEINLGINGVEIDKERIEFGIKEITNLIDLKCFETGSLLYSIGNAWLALKEYVKARDIYNRALIELDRPELSDIAAQCYKNMGTVMAHISSDDNVAMTFYLKALDLDPDLSEAHFSLALCHRKKNDFTKVLEHLDQVIFINKSDAHNASLQGWRIEALFNIGEVDNAFREINSLISHASGINWVLPWCANQVKAFGRSSVNSTKKSIKFWNIYLKNDSGNIVAKAERLLCLLSVKFDGSEVGVNFESFKNQVLDLIEDDNSDAAFWWDRIGHWAQCDNNWNEAEFSYRKAYELEPEQYGYCLGTALNFLGRFQEAYPILLEQAEHHLPDAKSWFQLAIACEGNYDTVACIFAYSKVIALDPGYDLAWFNLGGAYWNAGANDEAIKLWKEAIERFPEHKLTEELHYKFPDFFGI